LTYKEALDHLYSQLPMFQRIGAAAYKGDLSNTLKLCAMLGNPQTKYKTIHIAGTNGKGTTSHLLAAMLQAQGYKTGLYISPHYKDFRERIKFNGEYIREEAVTAFVETYREQYEKIEPSFFEITVAMAFDYFANEQVDIAVIETGMGGRLDSTNVIIPMLSVITNIGFDHMQFLGNTLPLIAGEKAGIIKQGVPVVIGETDDETAPVFIQKAKDCNSEIQFADKQVEFVLKEKTTAGMRVDISEQEQFIHQNISTELYGSFQLKNLATAWCAARAIQEQGFPLFEKAMLEGVAKVRTRTKLIGRWQFLKTDGPVVVCDSAHNEHGLKVSLPELQELPHRTLRIVLGFVNDKDLANVLPLFPTTAHFYFCKPDIPRGLDAEDSRKQAAAFGLKGFAHSSVQAALDAALANSAKEDLIFIGGSTFVVAEVV